MNQETTTMTTNTPNSLSASIELNDHAVALFQNGHYQRALLGFKHAMSVSKQALEDPNNRRSVVVVERPGKPLDDAQASPSMDQFMMVSSSSSTSCEQQQQQNNDEEERIYRRPIRFMTSSPATPVPTPILVSSGIIFNLALTMHIMAISNNGSRHGKGGDEQQVDLSKPYHLYELSYQCLQTYGENGELLNQSPLFFLAVMNNMGMIHQQLQEVEHAQVMFEKMIQLIMYYIDCGCYQTLLGGENEASTKCFFNNIKSFITSIKTAPAA